MKRLGLSLLFLGVTFLFLSERDAHAQQVTLSIDPPTQTAAVNSTFQVQVRVNTGTQSIHTVSAHITYDGTIITPQSVDTTGSFATIWHQNEINTSNEIIQLTGNLPSPGISGDNLLFATINFVASSTATTQLQFDPSSSVFRDSDNTNILSLAQSQGGIITVSAALTPEASGTPTVTETITPAPTSLTPTGLPNAGTTLPTYILLILVVLLAAGAVALLL